MFQSNPLSISIKVWYNIYKLIRSWRKTNFEQFFFWFTKLHSFMWFSIFLKHTSFLHFNRELTFIHNQTIWKSYCLALSWLLMNQSTEVLMASSNLVNWKSGRNERNFLVDAVFLNWPSDFVVSNPIRPLKLKALAIDLATNSIETSSSSSAANKINELICE